MATLFTEDYESGGAGDNVTTGTSSYTTLTASTKYTFSDTYAHGGTLSGKFDLSTDTVTARWEWTATSVVWWRGYLYFPSLPAADSVIGVVYNGTTVVARLKVLATGQIRLDDATTASVTSSASIATGAWVRFAWKVDPATTSGASSQVLRLYQGSQLEQPVGTYTEQLTGTAYRAAQTQVSEIRRGLTVAGTLTYYTDDDALDSTTEPAPTGATGGGDIVIAAPSMTADASWPDGIVSDEFIFTPPRMAAYAAFGGDGLAVTLETAAGNITIQAPSMLGFAGIEEPGLVVPADAEQDPPHLWNPRVRVAFTDWAGDPVWTDVTAWTDSRAGIDITRGRSDRLAETQTGTMSLVLGNRDGRFTPGNLGSPYYPNVKLGRPIKVDVIDTAKNWVLDPSFTDWSSTWFTATMDALGYVPCASFGADTSPIRAALEDVATAAFNIVVVGDSVGEGAGASTLGTRWIDRLQNKLRTDYPVAGASADQPTFTPAYYSMDTPTDWVPWESPILGGTATLLEDFGLGARAVQLDASGESVTYAVTGTKVEVFYLLSDFLAGTFDITIDGGSPTNVDSYDITAVGGVAAVWTSGTLSAGPHTVVVSWSSGNVSWSLGCKGYDGDYGKSVHVWDGSHGGWTAYTHKSPNMTHHQLIDPDLLVVSLGFNDAAAYGPGEFAAYLYDLVYNLRAAAGSDVPAILVALYNPRDAEAGWTYGTWADYVDAMRDAAAAMVACDFLDLSVVMADTWADPSMYADLVHPNDVGHDAIATYVAERIGRNGSDVAKVTWAAAAASTAVGTNVDGLRVGQTYTASAYVYVPTGSPDVRLDAPFSYAGEPTAVKDAWTRISVTFVATNTWQLIALVAATADAGDLCYLDDVQVELGSVATAFDSAGATVTPRFSGEVTSWPMTWPGSVDTYAESRLTASDGFKRLGRLGELRSMVEEEHRLLAPAGYWPLEDDGAAVSAGASDTYATSPMVAAQVGTGGEITFGTDLEPVGGVKGAWFVPADSTNGKYLYGSVRGGGLASDDWSVSLMFTGSTVSRTLLYVAALAGYLKIGTDSSGYLEAQWVVGSAQWTINNGEALSTLVADEPHHVVVTGQDMGTYMTIRLYLDGYREVLYAGAVGGGPILTPHGRLGIAVGGLDSLPMWSGVVGHVAYWDSTLTDAQIARLAGCRTGWHGDTTDQRVTRLAQYAGLGTDELDMGATSSTLSAQPTQGVTALAAMLEATTAENGQLTWGRDGRLQLRGRVARYDTVPTLVVTGEELSAPPEFALDEVMLDAAGNDVTVTRPGGASQRVVNAASVADYGPRRQTLDVPLADDQQAASAAAWRVNTYGEPAVACSSLEADLVTTATEGLRGALADADVGTRLTLMGLPAGAPAESIDLFVEGYSERIALTEWKIRYNTSPADAWPVWTVEDPVLGIVEGIGRVAY